MIKIILYAALIYILYRLVKGIVGAGQKIEHGRREGGEVIDEMVQDPQCGTYIPRQRAVRRRIKGEERYFCSEECAEKYEKDS